MVTCEPGREAKKFTAVTENSAGMAASLTNWAERADDMGRVIITAIPRVRASMPKRGTIMQLAGRVRVGKLLK